MTSKKKPLILPFAGLRPAAGRAGDVAAPPYDVLNTEEARLRAAGKEWSFLHVSKPEIDLPPGTDPYALPVYEKGRENFLRMVTERVLVRDNSDFFYLYGLTMGDHSQIGLVATASVAAYDENRIRKHEFTRPDKEDDRVHHVDILNAQTGPVFLTYRHSDKVDRLVAEITATKAEVDISADDNVRHTLWVVKDDERVQALAEAFNAMDFLYIADGHHRSAAASRVAARRAAANPEHCGHERYNYFLSVIFPDNQTCILDYNRVVRDLNGLSEEAFLKAVSERFQLKEENSPVKPATAGEFGMYMGGSWYRLQVNTGLVPVNDPVKRLDVSLLSDNLIEPILDISDPRRDKRIDFVGGIRGLKELERRVDSGEMKVAFSLFPTSLEALMAVADAGQVMPPKSTWFEPKLADGLVSHVLD
ncbi:MAG: DUF1015 family protein [Deltaproteobacteria bacterium]|nr:DUF1015 family protein [Deltaproteobacteria bacterium]